MTTRVLALSDVHVDYPDNRRALEAISTADHQDDALILAGDVTHDMGRLAAALELMCRRFAQVFFVPGNHELWVRGDGCADSLEKFEQVLTLCAERGVRTAPARAGGVWVVPLFSWYLKPEEGADSLYRDKRGDAGSLRMWGDEVFVRWPEWPEGGTAAGHFLRRNEPHVDRSYDAPVVSFSHFLPRSDLMYRTSAEIGAGGTGVPDRNPAFNFSRVAGTAGIERQVRALGSAVHVYGHQHRNRWREVDGVLYVSHCLGYPGEWGDRPPEGAGTPRVVWPANGA